MNEHTHSCSAAEAKRHFADLLGRVAYGGETIVIHRRGKPVAKLVPLDKEGEVKHLAQVKGWLDDDDPFFEAIEEITASRSSRTPRSIATAPARPDKRRGRQRS